MGTLMALELPDGAPAQSLPWIITFGPLDEDDDWEPVVVGPYERQHALALAEQIVADEDLMAVVEPLLPYTSVQDIRAEIAAAVAAGQAVEEEAYAEGDQPRDDGIPDDGIGDDEILDEAEAAPGPAGPTTGQAGQAGQAGHATGAPSPEEIRAGFARIAARLTGQA